MTEQATRLADLIALYKSDEGVMRLDDLYEMVNLLLAERDALPPAAPADVCVCGHGKEMHTAEDGCTYRKDTERYTHICGCAEYATRRKDGE